MNKNNLRQEIESVLSRRLLYSRCLDNPDDLEAVVSALTDELYDYFESYLYE